MIESLLLNFLFLLFPVIIFLVFFENRTQYFNIFALIGLASISMVLCMAYPIKLKVGYIIDLRYVPFIISALFLGYKHTFPLYVILNAFRFLIGVKGSVRSFIMATIIFLLVPYFKKYFMKQSPRNRIIIAVCTAVLTLSIYFISLAKVLPELNHEFWLLTAETITTYAVVMFFVMVLLEKIIDNNKNREAYLQAERFNVISDLSASVSHEIRNPLTVSSGFLQLLKKSENIGETERQYVEYSLLELNRAERIVSDFLAYAKPQSENMILSTLKEEMEYVKNVITPYANMYQVDIQYSFQNTVKFQYDKNQIQQCFINLLKNAVEAMRGKGGVLSIDVTEIKNEIVIKIEDTGMGMTKEEVSRLGRPYYSTKKEGTGLGLLMVYSTINKLNGKIAVNSEKGIGTTFTITIPV